jgi:cyclopropane-fatty-acyl-phospholipid synthase
MTQLNYVVESISPSFVVHTADARVWERLLAVDSYRAAMSFIRGEFEIRGDMVAALRWWFDRQPRDSFGWPMKIGAKLHVESWFQTWRQARRNIQFHYDRSNRFYQLFLDRLMVYSEGYLTSPSMSLDEAQVAKLELIARKLELSASDRFLDVGCGWGALITHAAERYRARAFGCTLSDQQCDYATGLVRDRGLQDRVTVEKCDYRTLSGPFDKISSVGMYEHVGRRRLPAYFAKLASLVRPGGLILNSGITRPNGITDDVGSLFISRFVFPGGELPHLGDVVHAAESAGLEVVNVEDLRTDYGWTCAEWVRRLQARRDECLQIVDALTYRIWTLYLAASAASFERGDIGCHYLLLRRPDRNVDRLTHTSVRVSVPFRNAST